MMTRFVLTVILLIGLMSSFTVAAQSNEVKANIAISVQQAQDIWTGQQVTLNLDLKTTGFSFSDSHFNLPEVNGAFLMQTDTTTVKMTETIDDETWQIIRYPLALYPQKAGQLEVPSIDVRFNTSAGFGDSAKAFEFKTEPLELTIKLPPGVKDGDLVITTSSFELEHEWQQQSGAAKTGDAITLTVTRRANDISAMLLPPLPVYRTGGLAAYPQAPEVGDRTNRGDLTGERVDTIIWVVEKPGVYKIPGIRFQWWDPDKQELKQQIIPGLSLDIPRSPANQATEHAIDKPGQSGRPALWLLIATFMALTAVFLWKRFSHKTVGQSVSTEKSTFASLQKACSGNQPGKTHSALHAWLVYPAAALVPNPAQLTLSEFARACNDALLTAELTGLEQALITPASHWQGGDLLQSLRRVRKMLMRQKTARSTVDLAPLNP